MRLTIINSGILGVEFEALRLAYRNSLDTGGHHWIGGPTDDVIKAFGLMELSSPTVQAAREENIARADAVMILARMHKPTDITWTRRTTEKLRKPCLSLVVPSRGTLFMNFEQRGTQKLVDAVAVTQWISSHRVKTLYITGSSEDTEGGIGYQVEPFLETVFRQVFCL